MYIGTAKKAAHQAAGGRRLVNVTERIVVADGPSPGAVFLGRVWSEDVFGRYLATFDTSIRWEFHHDSLIVLV